MTFDEFDEAVRSIAQKIMADGFVPTAIVAVTRGWWIPARLLSKHLGVKKLYAYGVTYANAARETVQTYQRPDVMGAKLLLVEDFLESARSMKLCLEQLVAEGNEVKTFALGYRAHGVIVPDYSLGQIDAVPELPWD